MPQLLTLPYAVPLSAVGALLPGAKLSFFESGTSTPQAVYQDIDLTVPHTQPVEADAAGRFPAIYFDPALPDYRITLTDSDDVTQSGYPIDDVPSAQNQAPQLRLVSQTPYVLLHESDAAENARKVRLMSSGSELALQLLNDAESSATDILRATRSTTTLMSLKLAGNDVILGPYAVKTGDQSRTSTTTLADDSVLKVSLAGPYTSQAAYIIEGVIYFDGANGAQGIKLGFSYSGTLADQNDATVVSYVNGTASTTRAPMTAADPLTFATIGTTSRGDYVRFSKVVSPQTLGVYSLQWAQNSSAGDATNVRIFSWMRAQRALGGLAG